MTHQDEAADRSTIRHSAAHWGAFRAEVQGGRLIRTLPFEHDPEPSPFNDDWPEMLTSPLRVAEPVVRRGWLEGDGGAARGDDEFVAVGWDRALDLAAREIARVRADHGNPALFAGSYGWASAGRIHHARTLVRRFFGVLGGFTDQVTNYSYGAAMAFLPRVFGRADMIGSAVTSIRSIRDHGEVMLAFGGVPGRNWAVSSGGFGEHRRGAFMAALEGRVRVVNISPQRSDADGIGGAEWLPIRPNTDTALMLALIHQIVTAGRHDAAFLDRFTAGADRLLAYVRGEADGQPKDPAWAEAITGVPAATIARLARDLPGRRVMVSLTWSLQRARHGEQPYWTAVALAAVLGQIGLPGGGVVFGYGSANGMGNPEYGNPISGIPTGPNPAGLAIPVARVADLLLNPGQTIRYDGRAITFPDIRLVYWAGGNPFHHHQDLNRLRAAFRRPDTVIVNECFWTATARHADIVFPATTALERDDIGGTSRDPWLLAMQRVVAPVGGARDDYAIFAALAERLGAGQAFTEGRTPDDWLRLTWDRITARLAARGIAAPDFKTFWRQGSFRLPEPGGDYVMLADFRADPVAHALPTPSGRIELGSDLLAGIGGAGAPGHPAWRDPEEWLGAPLAARFPLHLLTPQPARRLHGQMDWGAHSRSGKRQGREVVAMHPDDAAARGIAEGDAVRLWNDRGACHAVAGLDPGLAPGVVALPTGATYDPDGTVDRNSNPNVLTRDVGTSDLGQGCAAQSCLVEVARLAVPLPELRVMAPPPTRPAP